MVLCKFDHQHSSKHLLCCAEEGHSYRFEMTRFIKKETEPLVAQNPLNASNRPNASWNAPYLWRANLNFKNGSSCHFCTSSYHCITPPPHAGVHHSHSQLEHHHLRISGRWVTAVAYRLELPGLWSNHKSRFSPSVLSDRWAVRYVWEIGSQALLNELQIGLPTIHAFLWDG